MVIQQFNHVFFVCESFRGLKQNLVYLFKEICSIILIALLSRARVCRMIIFYSFYSFVILIPAGHAMTFFEIRKT